MQNIPVDITHTTVNFSVMLKSGDEMGDALPGAMVTLYSDDDGDDMVGEGETDDMGMASIRFAREGTEDNMVYAAVSSEDYDVADGMQAVMWDPKSTMAEASNAADIVNLNVDVTVSGATITTEYGGGDALAGWAMGVAMGTGDDAEALEGDHVPDELDDDGMASFKTTVESVPATYTFAVAADQADAMDGGEKYEGMDVEYTHDGLSLMGTMDAGTMEVKYTTQMLKVYVHHERDQIMGYTENILDGDERTSGVIDVDIRHIDENGRSRSFTSTQWNPRNKSDAKGVVTFRGVPAGANVIVQAEENERRTDSLQAIMLLDPDELATYRDIEENGVTGGAFGAMGGFNHTVELCPLTSEEHRQGGGECGSFAYVNAYSVSGLVWKRDVIRSGDGFLVRGDGLRVNVGNGTRSVTGITVSLDPVEDKNLAGDQESQTTKATNAASYRTAWDDRVQFNFGDIAAGVYKLNVSDGWRARLGDKDATDMIGDALNPLGGDVMIDVTPATATVYGKVMGSDGFGADSVTVTANGVSGMTDAGGRFILEGIAPETRTVRGVGCPSNRCANKIFLSAKASGFGSPRDQIFDFAANDPMEKEISLTGVQARATVSGTVTTDNGTPVAGVSIMAGGKAPINAETTGANRGKLVTGADGSFTAVVAAVPVGQTVDMSAHRAGMSFFPGTIPVSATVGSTTSGIKFTAYAYATITGRVRAPAGGPMDGVVVTATATGGGTAYADTTTTAGIFAVRVPFGSYDIAATKTNYSFEYANGVTRVSVAHGQTLGFGDIQARTFMAGNVMAMRVSDATTGVYDGNVSVKWANGTIQDGHVVTYQVESNTDTDNAWQNLGSAVLSDGDSTAINVGVPAGAGDGKFMVRVQATSDNGTPDDDTDDMTVTSGTADVGGIDPTASGVTAGRGADNDSLFVQWKATTNTNSQQRVLVEVTAAAVGATVWVSVGFITADARRWVDAAGDKTWTTLGGTSVAITAAELEKAIRVRVDSRQGATGDWTEGTPVAVQAKPST